MDEGARDCGNGGEHPRSETRVPYVSVLVFCTNDRGVRRGEVWVGVVSRAMRGWLERFFFGRGCVDGGLERCGALERRLGFQFLPVGCQQPQQPSMLQLWWPMTTAPIAWLRGFQRHSIRKSRGIGFVQGACSQSPAPCCCCSRIMGLWHVGWSMREGPGSWGFI